MAAKKSDRALPDQPNREDTVERWCAWATAALHADEMPIVGAYSLASDNTDEAAVVIQLANHREMMICPARSLASRRLIDEFVVLGCPVPYYTAAQVQIIAVAIGTIARRTRVGVEEVRSSVEFSSLGADWLGRCRVSAPIIELSGREGPSVRSAIGRVRDAVANERDVDRPPSLIFDTSADEILVWTSPFRRYVRERRGTTSDELLGAQMQRAGWRRVRLAARPGPDQKGTVELPVWAVYNGFQGFSLENGLLAGTLQNEKNDVVDRSDSPSRTRGPGRVRGGIYERSTTPNADDAAAEWLGFRHAVAGKVEI
jgi:hypothetical protein